MEMESTPPETCPSCGGDLHVTTLACDACGTEVNGHFTRARLVNLSEPHASFLEMFIRLRGNVKEMERNLGLSYPTVRARLEDALRAAGFGPDAGGEDVKTRRITILSRLRSGELSAAEAAIQLKRIQQGDEQ
jgi:hypothetical protein